MVVWWRKSACNLMDPPGSDGRQLLRSRVCSSTAFEPFGQWPRMIATTCGMCPYPIMCSSSLRLDPDCGATTEMTKQGELEPLKFPSFRRELLYQNHWNPGDDIGRIKIVISEGFPRDSPSNPVERVKNIVAFSFQHAPLGWSS